MKFADRIMAKDYKADVPALQTSTYLETDEQERFSPVYGDLPAPVIMDTLRKYGIEVDPNADPEDKEWLKGAADVFEFRKEELLADLRAKVRKRDQLTAEVAAIDREHRDLIGQVMDQATVLQITNVWEARPERFDPKALCLIPKFPTMFCEWRVAPGLYAGVLAHVKPITDFDADYRAKIDVVIGETVIGSRNDTGAEPTWVWNTRSFGGDKYSAYGPVAMWTIVTDQYGVIMGMNLSRFATKRHAPLLSDEARAEAEDETSVDLEANDSWFKIGDSKGLPWEDGVGRDSLAIWGQALTYLNCRNVGTIYYDPPERVQRKHQRKRGAKPLVRYHVINVEKAGAEEARSRRTDTEGGLVASHVVGGQLRHYGDCCPSVHQPKGLLFGKHSGRVFVPMHVRGNPQRGLVVADYSLDGQKLDTKSSGDVNSGSVVSDSGVASA